MSPLRKSLALLALMLTFAALPLLAEDDDDRFELKFGKDLVLRGGRVTIDHRFGELVIRTHAGSDVKVRATIRSSDDEIGKQIRIVTSEGPGGVSVRTDFPDIKNWRGRLSYSVDMNVTVPAAAVVSAKNQFGNIDAHGLHGGSVIDNRQGSIKLQEMRASTVSNSFGSVEIADQRGDLNVSNSNGSISVRKVRGVLTASNRFGSVEVTDTDSATTITNANGEVEAMDIGGPLKVTNAFGTVEASTIAGSVDITNNNARVELSNVNGSATVRSSFGNIVVTTIRGNLTVDNQNARVEATGISGNSTIDNSFGAVLLRDVSGMATVKNSNGDIRVSDIGGMLTAATQFGAVKAERVRGEAKVESANGSVTLTDVGASVRVRASFAPVFVNGAGGAVTVTNANGAISVAGMRNNTCQPLVLTTSFSSIKVALPEANGYTVNARTSFGRINTSLPVTTTSVSEGNLIGSIGRGGCKLDLVNANGNITIEKE